MASLPDVITVLEELIKIDSRNPYHAEKPDPQDASTWKVAGSETAISGYIENALRKAGFDVKRQHVHTGPDGTEFHNVLGEKGAGSRSILFYGHMDTMGTDSLLPEEEAFTPVRKKRLISGEEKETIAGLGASDMKAGLAVMLRALRDVSPDTHRIKVAFGVDEEFYSLGGNVLAASGFMDDVAGMVVPEIGNGPNVSHGPSTIVLGRLGRCEYVISVPGTGGHGAQAFKEDFVNAAVECAKIANRLESLRARHRDEFVFTWKDGHDENAPGRIHGSFFINRLEAGEGSLSVPSAGMVSVDWMFTPNFRIEDGLEKLRGLIDGMYDSGELRKAVVAGKFRKAAVNPRPRPTPASDAYITAHNHTFTEFAKKIVDETTGFRNFGMGYSVADENVFRRIRPDIPVLVIGPLGDDSHVAEEWVEIESVRRLEKVFTSIAVRSGEYLE